MPLMITVCGKPPATNIKVDGWLDGGGAVELLRVVAAVDSPVRLSLHDLRGADDEGVALLRKLADGGVVFDGLSPYIALIVADDPPAPEAPITDVKTRTDTPARRRRSA